jgi:glutathione S-transferase
MAGSRIAFYDWPYSPFCMKVRAILEYKRAAFYSVNPLAARGELRRRGTGKVPAIEIDGLFVTDSSNIALVLDERYPEPPLFPSSPRERGLCHALEDWADESLYFIGLYYRWIEEDGRKPVAGVFGSSLKGRAAYLYYSRLIARQLAGQGTLRKSPEHIRVDLERNLDAVEGMLDGGQYLLGDRPYLCDFAVWGQLNYLKRTPVGGRAIAGHAAVSAYVDRMAALGAA